MPKFKENDKKISYIFPKSEEIFIPRSDLQIQLQEFKNAVGSSFSIFDFIAIISLWSPVFANAFTEMFSISSDEIKAGYIILSIILTIIILYNKTRYNINSFLKKDKSISNDPKEMSQIILDKCNPQIKK
jgi:hypothetical protein